MGRIFYIMGKSSSGKDTIYKQLLNNSELNLRCIVMYTTRPIRDGETNGIEYFFSSEEELSRLEAEGKVIEVRSYNTVHGIWRYFTVDDEQMDLEKYSYVIIGTLESYNKTKKYYGEDKLVPIYIEIDDGVRLERALNREKLQAVPKYEEMCRRYLADQQDFSEKKIKQAGIALRFRNESLNDCINEISNYINDIVT